MSALAGRPPCRRRAQSPGNGASGYNVRMDSAAPMVLNLALAILICSPGAISVSAQDMDHSRPTTPSTQLKIQGLDGKSITLSPEEFAALPHKTVSVFNAHTGANEKYSGVLITDLLAKVGAPLGENLRGSRLLTGIIAEGTDNYHVLYALAEVDPSLHAGDVIVADSVDDHKLGKSGAFQMVSTEEKHPARWVRNLTAITVVAVKP